MNKLSFTSSHLVLIISQFAILLNLLFSSCALFNKCVINCICYTYTFKLTFLLCCSVSITHRTALLLCILICCTTSLPPTPQPLFLTIILCIAQTWHSILCILYHKNCFQNTHSHNQGDYEVQQGKKKKEALIIPQQF